MKIGVLTSVHSPFDVRIFHKECRSLARAGHMVTLVAPHARTEVVDGIWVRGVGGSRSHRFQRATAMVGRIYAEALRIQAAVYHLHDPELLPIGLLLRRRGKHVIYDAHEDLPHTIPSKAYLPKALHSPIALIAGHMETVIARRLTAVVAATPSIAQRFAPVNPKTVVVRNYVVLSEWPVSNQVPWHQRPSAVAYVGGITWDRGLREMVEALSLMPPQCAARLILAGPYSPPELRAQCVGLPGWECVEDAGVLSRPAVADLLGRVRAGLVVLQPTPNYIPSLPIKLFEYMAAGLPVVVSDFPVLRAIVQEVGCGFVVDPRCPAAIAQAIEFLLTHPAEAESMGHRGREAVAERYNWASEERTLQALYSSLDEQPIAT